MVRTPVAPIGSEEPASYPGRPFRVLIGLAVVVLIAVGTWLIVRNEPSGDPGGKVLAQLVPAASALPGYGTGKLPWTAAPSMSGPYLIKSEPRQESCDGMAGTQGWTQVVVQAEFGWRSSSTSLFSRVGARLKAFGWSTVPDKAYPIGSEAIWTKYLTNGSKASVDLSSLVAHHWEFVALAPPVGRAASGC